MKYEALVSFTGLLNMAKGDVREIPDEATAKDLLQAGYVKAVKEKKTKKKSE